MIPSNLDKHELHMWTYWRDKWGAVEALQMRYKDLLDEDQILYVAVAQVMIALTAIEKRMEALGAE